MLDKFAPQMPVTYLEPPAVNTEAAKALGWGLAAAIGGGGLGEFIFRGVAMVNHVVILAGAVPAALLALIADGGVHLIERKLDWRK